MKNNCKSNKNSTFKVIFTISMFFLVSLFMIIFFIKLFSQKTDNYLLYAENSSVDYSVLLKENKYYDVGELPSGMNYIASLIDKIKVKFNYVFTTNKDIVFDNEYYIIGTTRVYADKDKTKVLFEKSETLKNKISTKKDNIQYYAFMEDLDIDYNHFNGLVINFKNDYALNTVADLTIELKVKSNGKNDHYEDNIKLDSKSSLVIPLSEQTVNISININNIDNHNYLLEKFNINSLDKKVLFITVSLLLIDIILIANIVKVIIKYLKSISEYDKTLNKILREYDNIIANINSTLSINEDKQIIFVDSFEELLDIHDNLGKPILFSEIEKGSLSTFTIVSDEIVYKYALKNRQKI